MHSTMQLWNEKKKSISCQDFQITYYIVLNAVKYYPLMKYLIVGVGLMENYFALIINLLKNRSKLAILGLISDYYILFSL